MDESNYRRDLTIDGVEFSVNSVGGRVSFCGDELTREGAQALQELIYLARIEADMQRAKLRGVQ